MARQHRSARWEGCVWRPRRLGGRRRAGLTFLELLLALSITTLIGAAVGAMLLSVSTGVSMQSETRCCLVSHVVASLRIGEALRTAKKVLAAGDAYIVLWVPGESTDASPRLSQLLRIEHQPTAEELRCYRSTAELTEAQDVTYDLVTTDFDAVTDALKGTDLMPGHVWADNVTDWGIRLNAEDPRDARYVGYRMTMRVDDVTEATFGGAALRN